ncbi:MAG: Minf_1886 family protein [Thermogutta sp.]
MTEHVSPLPQPLLDLLKKDRRYKLQAYLFVFQALDFARQLGMGREAPSEPLPEDVQKRFPLLEAEETSESDLELEEESPKHVSGQELCEAARIYASQQYGYMAKVVLNDWGIYSTSDIGEIVYNLIRIGLMRKTKEDRREDFDNVYDFDEVFCQKYRPGNESHHFE